MGEGRPGLRRSPGIGVLVAVPAALGYLIFVHAYSLTRGLIPPGSKEESYRVCRKWPECKDREEPIPEQKFQPNRVQTCRIHTGVPIDEPAYGHEVS